MKLEYTIVWFEDNESWWDSFDRGPIESHIRELGFEPTIKWVQDAETFREYGDLRDVDLLVIDHDLGRDDEMGENIIGRVRGNKVYTEVIFYSAGEVDTLWNAVRSHRLEGIFVESRELIDNKVQKVVEQSVRKIVDLHHMRGILVAEVGDLDALHKEIFDRAFAKIADNDRVELVKRFSENAVKQAQNDLQARIEFQKDPELVNKIDRFLDSVKIFTNFKRLRKLSKWGPPGPEWDFQKEILGPRNFLAHGVPEWDKGLRQFTFRHQGAEFVFSDRAARDLRAKMIEYKAFLRQLLASSPW